jgi:hypothetical protein
MGHFRTWLTVQKRRPAGHTLPKTAVLKETSAPLRVTNSCRDVNTDNTKARMGPKADTHTRKISHKTHTRALTHRAASGVGPDARARLTRNTIAHCEKILTAVEAALLPP